MNAPRQTLLQPRRIGVTGALETKNADVANALCAAIGRALVEQGAVVVTRGGKATDEATDHWPVDELVVRAASEALTAANRSLASGIETVVAGVSSDRAQFHVGTIARVRGSTYESERFRFVHRLDGLIGIGGRNGTRQALMLALATERPILPVPTFDGASRSIWESHEYIRRDVLGVSDTESRRWIKEPATVEAAAKLGTTMVKKFLKAMAKRCFVIMPFHESFSALYDFVIEPAVIGLGHTPLRTDRAAIPGDVGKQINEGIERADYIIVVLDGLRPNVLYELGLAHGQGKPTILMNRRGSLGTDVMPFDITLQQRLEYEEVDGSLPARLQEAIRALGAPESASGLRDVGALHSVGWQPQSAAGLHERQLRYRSHHGNPSQWRIWIHVLRSACCPPSAVAAPGRSRWRRTRVAVSRNSQAPGRGTPRSCRR